MTRDETLEATLAAVPDATVHATGAGRWSLALASDPPVVVALRRDGEWLTLTGGLRSGGSAPSCDPAALLAANGTLAHGARFALPAADGPETDCDVALLADVPLDAGADVALRIAEACADFRVASRLPGAAPGAPCPASANVATDDLAARCREAGFGATPLANGDVAVDLNVPGVLQHAVVRRRAGGAIGVSAAAVEEAPYRPAAPACGDALALFLLRLAGTVRMVRPTAPSDGASSARLEVMRPAPTTAELAHMLSALSLACRLSVAEATALHHDEALAAAYLRRRGVGGVRQAA